MQDVPAEKTLDSAAGSLGGTLRAARERGDLSVHKAAQDLHVGDDIIEALERDDYTALGAPIFVRGHLRNYCRLLGLPEVEVLSVYEHTANKLVPPPLITQRPDASGAFARRFGLPVFSAVMALVLLLLAVSWWTHRPAERVAALGQPANSMTTKLPLAVASNQPEPSMSTRATGVKTPAPGATRVTMGYKAGPAAAAIMQPRSRAVSGTLAVTHSAPAETLVEQSAGSTPSARLTHVKFTMNQASWIEVYDASGKRLYYDLAPAGGSVKVSGTGPLQVFLGNAPGVNIELNGQPFNLTPFTRSDNTARFRLGAAGGSGSRAG